tara:strand:- start:825 stop:2315 length:1491 start_codon:yes stop_codon:yes gene_type:complete
MKAIYLASLVALLAFGPVMGSEDRPNILMIAVDDLRPMLGCYGDSRMRTPHIDQLAGEGMLFERAYCNYAKCGPSRLSLMTGLRPDTVGVYSHGDREVAAFREANPAAIPMSRWFRESGYHVRSFGKIDHDGWAVPEDWSEPPFAGREGEMLEIVDGSAPNEGTIIADRADCPVMQAPDVADDDLFAGRMTNEVIRQLSEQEGAQPFFYAVGFRRPHLPFVAPKRYYDLYEPDESWLAPNQEPPEGAPTLAWFNSDGYGGMMKKVGDPMPDPLTREDAIALNGFEMRSYVGAPVRGEISKQKQMELRHAYSACISYVDAQIGRLLQELSDQGLRENTIVLLWSDHGWHLGEMSAWGKMTNYEVATRVPLIVSAPGMKGGRTLSLAELVDLYPTLCELAEVDPPKHLEGNSLVPVLRDSSIAVKDAIRHEYSRYNGDFMGRAIRTERFRYVEWTNRKGAVVEEELYDLESDSTERVNLSKTKKGVAQGLQRLLHPVQ